MTSGLKASLKVELKVQGLHIIGHVKAFPSIQRSVSLKTIPGVPQRRVNSQGLRGTIDSCRKQ